MSEFWATIAKSRYLAQTITAEKVQSYVSKLISQDECDDILGTIEES